MSLRIAVIDMGTNTFHLLIVDKRSEGYEILHSEKQSVKIGDGGISNGYINEEAQRRALNALKHFAAEIEKNQVTEVHATATSAIRSAKNGLELVEKIKAETSIQVRIISGDEEALLIYKGVKTSLDLGKTPSLIMDIGGGSVEFIICNNKEVFWKQSFEIGAQRLLDKFHHSDPIKKEDMDALSIYLGEQLEPLKKAFLDFSPTTLVGASGSFDTLGEMQVLKGIVNIEDELQISIKQYNDLHDEMVRSTREERLNMPGMIPMRVDMIVVACCLINYVLNETGLTKIRISSASLKEGLLESVMNT